MLRVQTFSLTPVMFRASSSIYSSPLSDGLNPYNLQIVNSASQIGQIANSQIGNKRYRIATAGYSMVDASSAAKTYEKSTKSFLEKLDRELGSTDTAYITNPSIGEGSIDAITTEIATLNPSKLFYLTAHKFVDDINPASFPPYIDLQAYSKIPKYVLFDPQEYSKATAEASNVFIAIGGGKYTVKDFCNAIAKGNKLIILNNYSSPMWVGKNGDKMLVNASMYLTEQISAFVQGKPLLHPEVGEFTREFLAKHGHKFTELVEIINLDSLDEFSTLKAAKRAAKFIRG